MTCKIDDGVSKFRILRVDGRRFGRSSLVRSTTSGNDGLRYSGHAYSCSHDALSHVDERVEVVVQSMPELFLVFVPVEASR